MSDPKAPSMVSADRLSGCLVIAFDNGRCALYDAELLYATLPQAREFFEDESELPALEGEKQPSGQQ